MIPHIIITRYNEGLYSDNPFNIENPDGWMWERWNLFLETVNGMACQEGEFQWFITIDENTPVEWIRKISEVTMWYDCMITTRFNLKSLINDLYGNEWKATTRLDNDDYYNDGFIQSVQSRFEKKEKIIDTKGVQHDIINDIHYDDGRALPNSPFITLISKDKIVLDFEHTKAPDLFKCERINTPLWTQVLHGSNIANKPKGKQIGKDS